MYTEAVVIQHRIAPYTALDVEPGPFNAAEKPPSDGSSAGARIGANAFYGTLSARTGVSQRYPVDVADVLCWPVGA